MKFEEAEKMMYEYQKLEDFFTKYKNLRIDLGMLTRVERQVKQGENLECNLTVRNKETNCFIMNIDIPVDATLKLICILKEMTNSSLEKLMKENDIE